MDSQLEIIRSDRNSLLIRIDNGTVVVRAPINCTDAHIARFLRQKENWIQEILLEEAELTQIAIDQGKLSESEIKHLKQDLSRILVRQVSEYKKDMGISDDKHIEIKIRKMRASWGNCVAKRTANNSFMWIITFNSLLGLCPDKVIASVVVHELAHIAYPDHSNNFWNYVHRIMPEYDIYQEWLNRDGEILIKRMILPEV